MTERTLPEGTIVVLRRPYQVDAAVPGAGEGHALLALRRFEFTIGRITEKAGPNAYGVRFEGYRNDHGPIQVDFSRSEFVLARVGT